MSLILDTGVLIASEREGGSLGQILYQIRSTLGETEIACRQSL